MSRRAACQHGVEPVRVCSQSQSSWILPVFISATPNNINITTHTTEQIAPTLSNSCSSTDSIRWQPNQHLIKLQLLSSIWNRLASSTMNRRRPKTSAYLMPTPRPTDLQAWRCPTSHPRYRWRWTALSVGLPSFVLLFFTSASCNYFFFPLFLILFSL